MSPDEVASLFTEEALAALRQLPGFRAACEQAAAGGVAYTDELDPRLRWITNDLGRASICLTALVMHYRNRLTPRDLTAVCVANRTASAGRVAQVVRRCLDIGVMELEPGDGRWTQRPLKVGDALAETMRRRTQVDLDAALSLFPDEQDLRAVLGDQAGFMAFIFGVTTTFRRHGEIFGPAFRTPLDFFLDREAGMVLLFQLIGAQPPGRVRLLEEASVSRLALSRAFRVSRMHITRLLTESGHTRLAGDRVYFDASLSDELDRHFALIFQVNVGVARDVAAGRGGLAQAQ
jgi:hypothetical protein